MERYGSRQNPIKPEKTAWKSDRYYVTEADFSDVIIPFLNAIRRDAPVVGGC
jgi:hypothetical protein